MSKSTIDAYFKPCKINVSPSLPKSVMQIDDKVPRKRSLSLKKPESPSKSPRVTIGSQLQSSEIVDLCSDDESMISSSQSSTQEVVTPIKVATNIYKSDRCAFLNPSSSSTHGNVTSPASTSENSSQCASANNSYESPGCELDSSQATIIYSPQTPQTPRRTPQTPQRPLQTPLSSFKSPTSAKKYFSPAKKRAVHIKSPARRNLAYDMAGCSDSNNLFDKACQGLDDKTIFLLTIINKCICNPNLYRLLDESTQSLLSQSMQVEKPGMRLVCRLFWYKKDWYRIDKVKSILSGPDETIDDPTMHLALNSLLQNGFLALGGSEGNAISFDEFTTILSSEDLKQICKDLKLKSNTKQDRITALKKYSRGKSIDHFFSTKTNDNSSRVLNIMRMKAGPCYKLTDLARRAIHDLHILMYLGIDYDLIREKNLELVLINDKIQRETYPVEEDMLDDASVVFTERDEFQRYVNAHNTHEDYITETDTNKKCEIVIKTYEDYKNITNGEMMRFDSLPIWLRRFTPLDLYIRILEAGVQDLKKEQMFGLALEILDVLIMQDTCRQHKKAEWYAEKALVLHKCSRTDEAAQVLLEGFKSNLSEESKDIMRPRAKMFAKQKNLNLEDQAKADLLKYATKDEVMENTLRGVHVYKQPMDRIKQKGKIKFETRTADGMIVQDVEEYCLSHYISTGDEFTDGMHCEGKLVNTMFFLLFWDIIYWKPPNCVGVFLSRFQKYPLDLFCTSFYENRRDSIEARLSLIERSSAEELVEMMHVKWLERPESEQSGVWRAWGADGAGGAGGAWARVAAAARALGGAGAGALCRRHAADYRHAHAGFPDLTLWNTHTNKIRFVEVKSDTDKPSMKQIQWMHYLKRHNIDTEFCYVGVNTTRCKARPVS